MKRLDRSCVIVVENLPVPFDRRVWQEACALRDAGWRVSVICPRNENYPARYEEIEGIAVYRHTLPLEAKNARGFLLEYGMALFHEARLLLRVWRERGFSVIQACNPPDLIYLVAAPFKLLGKRFVFDHHDACPELYLAKFNRPGKIYRLLLRFERWTMRAADLVISANETYREIAIARGGKKPSEVVAVYSVPDVSRLYRVQPNDSLRNGKQYVLGYVGIIGSQDGVDHLVRAAQHLKNDHGRHDFQVVIVGDGPALPQIRALVDELKLNDCINCTGYKRGEDLLSALSTFDVGIIPDPVNAYNDKISMNKVFEYSKLGIPIIAYRLSETMRLLGDAALFANGNEPEALAVAIDRILGDESLRTTLATRAKTLADGKFVWEREARKYVGAMEGVLGQGRALGYNARPAE